MQIGNALNIGVQGFQDAQSRATQAAQDIASQSVTEPKGSLASNNTDIKESTDTKDLTSSLVDLKVAEHHAQANAKVIQTASDILGTLLDVTA